jgi:hypothetical protein
MKRSPANGRGILLVFSWLAGSLFAADPAADLKPLLAQPDKIALQHDFSSADQLTKEAWRAQMTGKPIILSDWSLSFPVEGHANTMWPQFPTPAAATAAYEAYLTSAFAKPYILGHYKCQYRDAILPTGQLKQCLRTVDGELRKDWAASLNEI